MSSIAWIVRFIAPAMPCSALTLILGILDSTYRAKLRHEFDATCQKTPNNLIYIVPMEQFLSDTEGDCKIRR